MSLMSSSRALFLLAAVVASSSVLAAQGRLGFAVAADTDGIFSKTLKSIKITAVSPGAPAEQAGLRVGDDVEAINDVVIVGANGSQVMDIVHGVQPGQHLRLKVKHDGAERLVDIVAGAAK
jgi:C-terminal processing protease CtpA/Prc